MIEIMRLVGFKGHDRQPKAMAFSKTSDVDMGARMLKTTWGSQKGEKGGTKSVFFLLLI